MYIDDFRVSGSQSGTAYATKGTLFRCFGSFEIAALFTKIALVAGATYRARIYKMSGLSALDTITEIVDNGVPFVAPAASAFEAKLFPLSAPVTLEPGHIYCMAISRTDSTGTTVLTCAVDSGSEPNPTWFPIVGSRGRAQYAFANPIVGNAMSGYASSGCFGIGMIGDPDSVVFP